MSNEISASLSISISFGADSVSGSAAFKASAQANGFSENEQLIGTTATALDFENQTTPQLVFIKNLDPNNYVQIDANNSFNGFPQKLLPGEAILLTPETGTIYAKANVAAVLLAVVVC
jgi:hypothetical protein